MTIYFLGTALVTAWDMGRRMGLPLPEEVIIYAIEVENIIDFSEKPTPAVAEAIPKATADCRVVVFDSAQLLETFQDDPAFGYLMIEKAAQIIRGRLQDMRIESLADYVG